MPFNELDWVEFLKKRAKRNKSVVAGIGDDCAVIRHRGRYLLFTSDLFIEGVHFLKGKMSLYNAGRRAAARAMSDIVACGGIPKYLGVSCGVPYTFKPREMKQLFCGINDYCRRYSVTLIGGDTSAANCVFLDVWVIGEAKKYILRSGARYGDYIFLTGPLGKVKFNEVFELRIGEIQRLLCRHKRRPP